MVLIRLFVNVHKDGKERTVPHKRKFVPFLHVQTVPPVPTALIHLFVNAHQVGKEPTVAFRSMFVLFPLASTEEIV